MFSWHNLVHWFSVLVAAGAATSILVLAISNAATIQAIVVLLGAGLLSLAIAEQVPN
jgi:hypothetical protein